MRQDNLPNIYGRKNNHANNQRIIIIILCITICVLSVISCVILIKNIQDRKNHVAVPTETTALQTVPGTSVTPAAATAVTAVPSVTPTVSPTSGAVSSSSQTATAEKRAAGLTALSNAVNTLLDAQSGRYSMYYINLSTGETLGYHEADPMVSASSIKIAYNTYLYKQAAESALSLDEWMEYNAALYPEGDLETGTGIIQTSADGTKYQLSTLSNLSVTISDNCATNMILRRLGGIDAVNDGYMAPISSVVDYRTSVTYTDYAGIEKSGKQRTSATDLAMYAKNLYTLYTASPVSYEKLITDLCTTEYPWGIPGGVPGNYKVAHKVGFNPAYGTNNDVGIVFAQEDYVLCVMTESGNASEGQALIGQVSKLVSDYITGCYS